MKEEYYRLNITMMGRSVSNKQENYIPFDRSVEKFRTMKELKNWLSIQYGTFKRIKCDSGYIYCFKNADYSHSPIKYWYQRDICEITHVIEESVF